MTKNVVPYKYFMMENLIKRILFFSVFHKMSKMLKNQTETNVEDWNMGPNWISERDQICIINPHPLNFRNKLAKELLNVIQADFIIHLKTYPWKYMLYKEQALPSLYHK